MKLTAIGNSQTTRLPLRDRGGDILQVAKAFLHSYGGEYAKPRPDLRPSEAWR